MANKARVPSADILELPFITLKNNTKASYIYNKYRLAALNERTQGNDVSQTAFNHERTQVGTTVHPSRVQTPSSCESCRSSQYVAPCSSWKHHIVRKAVSHLCPPHLLRAGRNTCRDNKHCIAQLFFQNSNGKMRAGAGDQVTVFFP